MQPRRDHVGDVCVDSGPIAIVGPAYLTRTLSLFLADVLAASAVCLNDSGTIAIVGPACGGKFPVYAERDARGLTTRVVVDFTRDVDGPDFVNVNENRRAS
jgi:hypothetical protein